MSELRAIQITAYSDEDKTQRLATVVVDLMYVPGNNKVNQAISNAVGALVQRYGSEFKSYHYQEVN